MRALFSFGGPLPPCLNCGRKDYAAGCSRGCTRRDQYLAEKRRAAEARRREAAAQRLLSEGAVKAIRRG